MKLLKYLLLLASIIAFSLQCKFDKYGSDKITPFGEFRELDQNLIYYYKGNGDGLITEKHVYSSCNNFCDKNGSGRCLVECLSFKGTFVTHYYYTKGEYACSELDVKEYFGIKNQACNIQKERDQLYFVFRYHDMEMTYNIESGEFKLDGNVVDMNVYASSGLTINESPVLVLFAKMHSQFDKSLSAREKGYCENAMVTIDQIYQGNDCENYEFTYYETLDDGNIRYSSITKRSKLSLDFIPYDHEKHVLEPFNKRGFTKLILRTKDLLKEKIYLFDFKRKPNCYKSLQSYLKCEFFEFIYEIKDGEEPPVRQPESKKERYIYELNDNLELTLIDPETNTIKDMGGEFYLTEVFELSYLSKDFIFKGKKNGKSYTLKGKPILSMLACYNHLKKIKSKTQEIIMIEDNVDKSITLNKRWGDPFNLEQYFPIHKGLQFKIAKIHEINEKETKQIYKITDIMGTNQQITTHINMFDFLDCDSVVDEFYLTEVNNKYKWISYKGKLMINKKDFTIALFNFEDNKDIKFGEREITCFKEEKENAITVWVGGSTRYRSRYNEKCFQRFQKSLDDISFCKNGFRYSGYEILHTSDLADESLFEIEPKQKLSGKIRNNILLEFLEGKYKDFVIRKLNTYEQNNNYSVEIQSTIKTRDIYTIVRIFFDFEGIASDCGHFETFVKEQPSEKLRLKKNRYKLRVKY
jgi:hypothetical protein